MHRRDIAGIGCLMQQLRRLRYIVRMVCLDRIEGSQIKSSQRIMQLQRRFKPSLSSNLVLFHPRSEKVENSQIGGGCRVAGLKGLSKQLYGKIPIFFNADTMEIDDCQVHLGLRKS